MRRASLYGIVAIAAAAAGFVIFKYALAPRMHTANDNAAAQVPEPQAELPPVPTSLPEFSLQDREGQLRSIGSWSGKSMIVNFWATWCAPCRREIPLLKQIQQERTAQGFQVVGVAVDVRDEVLQYATKIDINYPLLIGEQDGLDAVIKFGQGSIGFPFTAFTDQQHRIVALHQGELTRPQADKLLAVIERLNRGEMTLEAARTMADEALVPPEGSNT